MVCPKCGKELNSDILFCEHCGEEIRIVSDFDPEVDGIVSDYSIKVGEVFSELDEKKPKKRFAVRGLIGLLVIMIAGAAGIGLYFHFSGEHQYQTAKKLIQAGKYSNAAEYARRAVELEPDNVEYLTAMLGCLMYENDTEQAKELCRRIIELDGSVQEPYRVLISMYEKEMAFREINELLHTCPNEQIVSTYASYLVKAPEFSEKTGTFDETFSLKMIANTKGTIYYTMDGSIPDENSEVYTSPIFLESGYYQIRAVFVSDYGVRSEETVEVYYVDQTAPSAPVVLPDDGEYSDPTLITVEAEEDCVVYYTTDGSAPTQDSTLYNGPFSMPVGVSHFRFVSCSAAGLLSEEAESSFSLNLHANLSIEAAKNKLLIELMSAEVIQDMNGSVRTGTGHNVYHYRYVVTVQGRDFYLYREYYEDDAGNSAATGTEYVVDVMDGQCYKAVQVQNQGEEPEEEFMKNPWESLKLQNILSDSISE